MIVVNNNDITTNQDKISLLYFSASWCGPCKILKPVMNEISVDMVNDVDIFYIDINNNIELSAYYQIMSVPTILFIKEKEIKHRITGLQPKTTIINEINKLKI